MLLYHEKQVAALCGVHCLNTLLQGPYFNELELAQIAQALDELERALVGGDANGEASGNVAMDGMFSIQVLSRALESWNLQVVSLESEEARELKATPSSSAAFICNLHEHWFTLRRVAGGEWWNFNSLFPAPQPLSTFYLQAFLDTLRGEGWTIFVVTGSLPSEQPGSLDQIPNAQGRWWSPQEARAATDEAERARKRGRLARSLEGVLARAEQQGGQLQLQSRGRRGRAGGDVAGGGGGGDELDGAFDEDEALAAAIAASLQSHTAGAGGQQHQQQGAISLPSTLGDRGGGRGYGLCVSDDATNGDDYEDDPELAMAIAASLAEASCTAAEAGTSVAPQPPLSSGGQQGLATEAEEDVVEALGPEPEADAEGIVEVAFRLPSGARCSRLFLQSAPAAHLFTFAAAQMGVPPQQVTVSTAFPKQELPRTGGSSLSELGLSHRTMLVVESKK